MLWSDLDIASWDFKRTPAVQSVITKQNLQVLRVPAGTSVLPIAFSMQLEDAIQVWDLSSLLEQDPEKRSENLQRLQQDYQRSKERWLVQYEGSRQATLLGQMQEQGIFPAVSTKRFGAELYIEPVEQERLLLLLRYMAKTIVGAQGTPPDLDRILHVLQQQTTAVVPFKDVVAPPPPPTPPTEPTRFAGITALTLSQDVSQITLPKSIQYSLRAYRLSVSTTSIKYLYQADSLNGAAKYLYAKAPHLLNLPLVDESLLLNFYPLNRHKFYYTIKNSWTKLFWYGGVTYNDRFTEVSLEDLPKTTADYVKIPLQDTPSGKLYAWLVAASIQDTAPVQSSIGLYPAFKDEDSEIAVYNEEVYRPCMNLMYMPVTDTVNASKQCIYMVPSHYLLKVQDTAVQEHIQVVAPSLGLHNVWLQSKMPEVVRYQKRLYKRGPVQFTLDWVEKYKKLDYSYTYGSADVIVALESEVDLDDIVQFQKDFEETLSNPARGYTATPLDIVGIVSELREGYTTDATRDYRYWYAALVQPVETQGTSWLLKPSLSLGSVKQVTMQGLVSGIIPKERLGSDAAGRAYGITWDTVIKSFPTKLLANTDRPVPVLDPAATGVITRMQYGFDTKDWLKRFEEFNAKCLTGTYNLPALTGLEDTSDFGVYKDLQGGPTTYPAELKG